MPSHEDIWKEQGDESLFQTRHIKHFTKYFNKSIKRVLDIGCGPGADSLALAKKGYDVYALDISPTAVNMCRKKLAAFPRFKHDLSERIVVHDMNKRYPFKVKMDAALSFSVLHHTTPITLDASLKHISKTLKKGGYLFISIVNKNKLKRTKHIEPKFGRLYKFGNQYFAHKEKDIYHPVYDDKIGTLTKERHTTASGKFKPVLHIFFDERNIKTYFGKYFEVFDVRKKGFMLLVSMKKK